MARFVTFRLKEVHSIELIEVDDETRSTVVLREVVPEFRYSTVYGYYVPKEESSKERSNQAFQRIFGYKPAWLKE